MATYTWRSTSGGAFDNALNWSPSSVPSAGDVAQFAQSGGLITGSGSVDTVLFSAANWTIGGQIGANAASIDFSSVDADSAGQFVVNGALSVGLAGSAALTASNGGLVAVTGAGAANFGQATLNLSNRGVVTLNGPVNFGRSNASTTAVVDASVLTVGGVLQLGASLNGSGTLTLQDSGQVVVSAGADPTTPYFQLGGVAGSAGYAAVSGAYALLLVSSNSGAVGLAGTGTLNVVSGGTAQFATSNNGLDPALEIGLLAGAVGVVGVSGSGSTLGLSGSLVVGGAGSGTLRVLAGATATAQSFAAAQAALAVAAGAGGGGSLVVDGGSTLTASGAAVIGGDNRGAGLVSGGAGSVVVTGASSLQTGSMTILSGSLVALDSSSQEGIGGTLINYGKLSSFGTLSISGTVAGAGTLQIGGGLAIAGALSSTNVSFTGSSGSLRVYGLSGTSSVSGMQEGDVIDLVGMTGSLSGSVVAAGSGALSLGASASGLQYAVSSDGNGGTFVTVSPATVGVYRFFDSNYGTHFFSSSSSEKNSIIATRPDLVYEGVGLESIDPASADPNAAPVFRFFDTSYGTHFFTASTSERDTVIASRPDLVYEGVGFIEHTAQQPGDVAVYRFFDTHYGTHFYTADSSERSMIVATRPDLVYEGIGFYAPS